MIARKNPFRTDRILGVRYRLSEAARMALLDRFRSTGFRGALVGRHGSGKTTLLEDLAPALRARGFETRFLRLDEEAPCFEASFLNRLFATLGPRDCVLLDGAEQMGRGAWRRFERETRRAGGLLITSHDTGLLPTLLECRTTPELLDEIVRELVGPEAEGLPLRRLFEDHRGNLRAALRSLYDHYAAIH